jgi:hypothetical protein
MEEAMHRRNMLQGAASAIAGLFAAASARAARVVCLAELQSQGYLYLRP